MDSITTPAASQQPRTPCRCCAAIMDAAWQPPLLPGRAGYWIVTCNKNGCGMYGYTFGLPRYSEVKLENYLKG